MAHGNDADFSGKWCLIAIACCIAIGVIAGILAS